MTLENKSIADRYFGLILLVFLAFAATFAIKLLPAVIPDEPQHFIVSQLYSEVGGIPEDSPESYQFSYLGHSEFLYYWINGRILNLLHLISPSVTERVELVTLRLVNVIYSAGTLIFLYQLAKEVIPKKGGQVLVVFLMANTLMFVFLSGGVNYDNLVDLVSVAGFFYLIRAFKGSAFATNSLLSFSFFAFGGLVKRTILPVAFIVFIVWIFFAISQARQNRLEIPKKKSFYLITVIFLVLIIGNFMIYGVNIIKYRAIKPPCTKILTEEQCEFNAVYRRNQVLREHSLTTERWITVITDGEDPFEYFSKYWFESMLKRIYGIMGHKSYFPDLIITFYWLLFIWVGFWAFREWKISEYTVTALIIIVLFYTLVLMLKNYSGELMTNFKHVGVQGRYFFPALPVLYVILVYYSIKIRPVFLQKLTLIYMIILFTIGAPITFLWNYEFFSSWFI